MAKKQKVNKIASLRGKRNRASGQRFERKVRADLESKGWIVDRWSNNVLLPTQDPGCLIPAKSRFGMRTTGFPDFIAFKEFLTDIMDHSTGECKKVSGGYEIIGVECKSNGYLDKEEKEKCRWLLANHIFSKILIAKKGKKRGEIIYEEFK